MSSHWQAAVGSQTSGNAADISAAGGTAFDARAFRDALGQFAAGVAIVTARTTDGTPIGMTMCSFNSVSLDPPLVLFSVDRRAFSLPAMLGAEGYAVNILSRAQEHLSDQFARALHDKWENVEYTLGYAEAPLLTGALAQFECQPYARHDGGDHVIFVCRVLRFSSDALREPLVFYRGRYHGVRTA